MTRRPGDGARRRELPVLGNDVNQCLCCRHLTKVGRPFTSPSPTHNTDWTCAAWPEGIPAIIVEGYFDHRESTPGSMHSPSDGGITFEPHPELGFRYEDIAGETWNNGD